MPSITSILIVLSLTAAVVCALRIQAPRGVFFGRLLALLALAWGVEVGGGVSSSMRIPNVIVYNLYAGVEFAVLMDLVRLLRPRWRPGLLAVTAAGLGGLVYSAIMTGPTRHLAVEGLLVIGVLSSGVFLCLLVDLARTAAMPLWQVPAFWLFTGALLYFGGTIPVLGSWRSMVLLDKDMARAMYTIVAVLAIVRYLLAAVACWLEYRNRKGSWTSPN